MQTQITQTQTMQKPDYPIRSEPYLDYGLTERVARHLAASPLHVFSATVASSMPAEIGDPHDPNAIMMVDFTLVTDGRRGWLVLVPAEDDFDVEVEMTELVASLLASIERPPKFVVRATEDDAAPAPGVLDLRDAMRARIEAEFERHFQGVAATDVEPFLEPFRTHDYALRDELAIRREMNQDQ